MSYYERALKSSDPRFARVLNKLGYGRRDMVAEPAGVKDDELKAVREEYLTVVGKQPFHGWGIETLREKIAAASETDKD